MNKFLQFTTLSLALSAAASLGADEGAVSLYHQEAEVQTELQFSFPELGLGQIEFVQELHVESEREIAIDQEEAFPRILYSSGQVEQMVNHQDWRHLEFEQFIEESFHPALNWEEGTAVHWFSRLEEEFGSRFKSLATTQFHYGLGIMGVRNGETLLKDIIGQLDWQLRNAHDPEAIFGIVALMNELKVSVREATGGMTELAIHFEAPDHGMGMGYMNAMTLLEIVAPELKWEFDAAIEGLIGSGNRGVFGLSFQIDDRRELEDRSVGTLSISVDFSAQDLKDGAWMTAHTHYDQTSSSISFE